MCDIILDNRFSESYYIILKCKSKNMFVVSTLVVVIPGFWLRQRHVLCIDFQELGAAFESISKFTTTLALHLLVTDPGSNGYRGFSLNATALIDEAPVTLVQICLKECQCWAVLYDGEYMCISDISVLEIQMSKSF